MKVTAIDGLPVIDATEPLILNVTNRDIRGSNRKEPSQCAIARAARRELHVHEARVHLSRIYLRTNPTNWVRYRTPASARDEIIAFDRGGEFAPTELYLAPVEPTKRLGNHPKREYTPHGGKKPRAKPHVVSNVRGGPA